MSEILLGVLRMPPEIWDNGPLDVAQRQSFYLYAADQIEGLEAENQRLREAIETALLYAEDVHLRMVKQTLQDALEGKQ